MDQNDRINEKVIFDAMNEELDRFIDRVFELSQQKLVEGGKIDTGTMFKTANIEREYLKKSIVYPANYAEFIEFGRLPGSMPPVEPLAKWCRRKLRIPAKESKAVAWAIAKAIEERGIAPFPFLEQSATQAAGEFTQ